ncbi:MAG: hypothetical protein L0332_27575 [Chloroflexi bacterium]|nr:hypothetical protein [Chloroflexota bacterium]MCI0730459.1 hypothetical protein [Chloroflexota bacterium]
MTQTVQCPSCNATLDYREEDGPVVTCPHCYSTVVVPQANPATALSPQQTAGLGDIIRLVQAGNKIAAIQLYRKLFGANLRDAKAAVERLELGQPVAIPAGAAPAPAGAAPGLAGAIPQAQRATRISFLGQWGCLMFGFFWVAFLLVMVGTLIFPNSVRLVAPLLCPAGYEEAYGERVGYYRTNNFEGNNVVLLQCVYGQGRQVTAHPLLTSFALWASYFFIGGILIFLSLLAPRVKDSVVRRR